MQKEQKINQGWLTRRTGDPFADIGGRVIQVLMEEWDIADIYKLIEKTTKIYVSNWGGKLNAFFLNSKITQPAFQGARKIDETLAYYKRVIDEAEPHETGYCRIIGEYTKVFPAGRDNHIMSGSGTFVNFHHAFQGGLMLSKEALIRIFFVPLGCVQLNDKIALIDSNNEELAAYFVRKNVEENLRKVATKIAEGVLRSEFKHPASALFDFVQNWISAAKSFNQDVHTEIQLYHFTNFGASPEIILHTFSNALFQFYAELQHRHFQLNWQQFTRSHFYQKNTSFNEELGVFEIQEKSGLKQNDYTEFKHWYNRIYDNLLKGIPIHKDILYWVRQKRKPLHFGIVKLYQILIRNMNEKTLQIIERIADYVLQDENSLKKNIRALQKAQNAMSFRRALLKLEERNLAEKQPAPLFTLKEYAYELFPDGSYWQETQSLLLIAIYQKMHEQKIWLDDEDLNEPEEVVYEDEN